MIHTLELHKPSGHTYLLRYRAGTESRAMMMVGHLAADDRTDFSWFDAGWWNGLILARMAKDKQLTTEGFCRGK